MQYICIIQFCILMGDKRQGVCNEIIASSQDRGLVNVLIRNAAAWDQSAIETEIPMGME